MGCVVCCNLQNQQGQTGQVRTLVYCATGISRFASQDLTKTWSGVS